MATFMGKRESEEHDADSTVGLDRLTCITE